MLKLQLLEVFNNFQPEYIIHLAARADTKGETLEEYDVNITGTENVIDVCNSIPSIKHVIITSTQFVYQKPNCSPINDEDFSPHTIYGVSKVKSEQITRMKLNKNWTIVRPTNIWGPWHNRYPFEFWKIIAEGKYLHPSDDDVIRSYGYVGNICYQIFKILAENDNLNQKVIYLGDYPTRLIDWVDAFSLAQTGKKVKRIPKQIVFFIALIGTLLHFLKIRFPITISRYKSMTTNNPAPMEKTFLLLGEPPLTLSEGVQETVNWFKTNRPELIRL